MKRINKLKIISLFLSVCCLFLNFSHTNAESIHTPSEGIPTVSEEQYVDESLSETLSEEEHGITVEFAATSENPKTRITNQLLYSLTPTSTGYYVTFKNIGVDKISTCTFTLSITDVKGNPVASKSATLSNLKVGDTKYTWTRAKSDTVQETIKIKGSAKDGKETFIITGSTVRYNFTGGQYSKFKPLGGERHHMPSVTALTQGKALSRSTGPCIRMLIADHHRTASYGSTASAVNFRTNESTLVKQGKFLAAQKLGINDIQKKFGTKYNAAIDKMVSYTKGLGYTK